MMDQQSSLMMEQKQQSNQRMEQKQQMMHQSS